MFHKPEFDIKKCFYKKKKYGLKKATPSLVAPDLDLGSRKNGKKTLTCS